MLSHAQISAVTDNEGGHVMTGFVCDDNKYYIYDNGITTQFDWTKKNSLEWLREYFQKKFFHGTDKNKIILFIVAVWINKQSLTNEKITRSLTNKTEILKLRNNLKKLGNSRREINEMIKYNYFNDASTRNHLLKTKLEPINAQIKNIKNKLGKSNMYIPNVENLRRAVFSPKKQLPRTPNTTNVSVPNFKITNNNILTRVSKARNRSNRLKKTTNIKAFVKPTTTSESRAIHHDPTTHGLIVAGLGPRNRTINLIKANKMAFFDPKKKKLDEFFSPKVISKIKELMTSSAAYRPSRLFHIGLLLKQRQLNKGEISVSNIQNYKGLNDDKEYWNNRLANYYRQKNFTNELRSQPLKIHIIRALENFNTTSKKMYRKKEELQSALLRYKITN